MEWLTEWWTGIDWNAGYWAAVGGLSAAITGVVAIGALVHAARDSRERSRPVMVAEYRVPENPYKRLYLVIRNAGASVARDIQVTFDPEMVPTTNSESTQPFIAKRYKNRIPSLGPGQELTNVVVIDDKDESKSDLPWDLTISISYKRGWVRRYRDEYRLLTETYTTHTYSTSTDSLAGRVKQIRDELRHITGGNGARFRDIRNAIQEISKTMDEDHARRSRSSRVGRANPYYE